jgi:hypothetical protein
VLLRYDGLPVEAGGTATEHERGDIIPARWHGSGARKRPRGAAVSSGTGSSSECGGGLEKTSGRAPPASGGGAGGRWRRRGWERRRPWHRWEEERQETRGVPQIAPMGMCLEHPLEVFFR